MLDSGHVDQSARASVWALDVTAPCCTHFVLLLFREIFLNTHNGACGYATQSKVASFHVTPTRVCEMDRTKTDHPTSRIDREIDDRPYQDELSFSWKKMPAQPSV